MAQVKALIFDVDGTLAETEEVHRAAFNAVFCEHGLPWQWDQETYRRLLTVTGGKERIRAWLAEPGAGGVELSDADIAAMHAEKTAKFGDLVDAGIELRNGIAGLIETAQATGIRVAVATTTTRANVERLCRSVWDRTAPDVFEVIVAGDDVPRKKPDPVVYVTALGLLELAPGDALAFEDSRNGVLAAKGAGLRVVASPAFYTDPGDVDAADMVCPEFDDPQIFKLAGLGMQRHVA